MRTELMRLLPTALLAVMALATCAPDPALVTGDAPSPVTLPSTTARGAGSDDEGSGPTSSAAPSGAAPAGWVPEPPAATPAERTAPEGVDPRRVRIPAIGVDAHVGPMGLNDDGSIEVPEEFDDAGWWSYSPRPGHAGASAILGHVDSRTGPAVFFRLPELRPGDEIHVDGAGGRTVTFVVRAIEQHPKASFPSEKVFGATPHPSLRLITCGGAFDSNAGSHLDNVIVFADRVSA